MTYTRNNREIVPKKLTNEYVNSFSLYTIKNFPYWIKDDPFLTHFFNAMSLTFPDGERFFMKAVKNISSENENISHLISDDEKYKKLRRDIKGFLAQEAYHGKAHEKFNEFLVRQGYEAAPQIIKLVQDALRLVERTSEQNPYLLRRYPLLITCGLEHITAIMAEVLLTRKELTEDMMDDHVRELWIWHAKEELEHKAVAYDVYQEEKFANYFERVFVFLVSSLIFIIAVHAFQLMLIASSQKEEEKKLLLDKNFYLNGLVSLYGVKPFTKRTGFIAGVIPSWLEYLKPGYHPWKHQNNSHLLNNL